MSDSIKPEELWALHDGELSPPRQAEVRRALAADPALAGAYERLAELDRAWSAAAGQARIGVTLPPIGRVRHRSRPWQVGGAILLLLVTIRLITKMPIPFPIAVGIHAASLATVLATVLWLARSDSAGGDIAAA